MPLNHKNVKFKYDFKNWPEYVFITTIKLSLSTYMRVVFFLMLHIKLSTLCCTDLLLQFIHKFLILLLLFLLFIKCFLCPELPVFGLYFKSCIIFFCPHLCLWFGGFSWFTFTCCWSSSFLSTLKSENPFLGLI